MFEYHATNWDTHNLIVKDVLNRLWKIMWFSDYHDLWDVTVESSWGTARDTAARPTWDEANE